MKHRAKKRVPKTVGKTPYYIATCDCGSTHIVKGTLTSAPKTIKCPSKSKGDIRNINQIIFKYKDKKLDGNYKFKENKEKQQ